MASRVCGALALTVGTGVAAPALARPGIRAGFLSALPSGEPPLFTEFTYEILGVPRNPDNPFLAAARECSPAGAEWVDPGLGGLLAGTECADMAAENHGSREGPTLHNVDRRPSAGFIEAYTHNGFFKSLEGVRSDNRRDAEDWPPPAGSVNVNTDVRGSLGLTPEDEAAIVAFLRTPLGWVRIAAATAARVCVGVARLAGETAGIARRCTEFGFRK